MNDIDPLINKAIHSMPLPDDSPSFFERVDAMIDDEVQANARNEDTVVPMQNRKRRFAFAALVPAAAAAVAAVLLVSGLNDDKADTPIAQPPSTEVTQIKTLLASDVSKNVVTALRSIKAVRGHYEVESHSGVNDELALRGDGVTVGDFVKDSNGSYRNSVTSSPNGSLSLTTLQGETGALRTCDYVESSWTCQKFLDFAPADPLPLDWSVSSTALANAIKDNNVDLTEDEFDGEPVWKLSFPLEQIDANVKVDRVVVLVDRKTNFPLVTEITNKGKLIEKVTISSLVVDPPLTDADFTFETPKGASEGASVNRMFPGERTNVAGLRRSLGHDPVLPTAVPDGFKLAEITYSPDLNDGAVSWCGGTDKNVMLATYRKGLEYFTVSIDDAARNETDGCNFWGQKRETPFFEDQTKLTSGAFAGLDVSVGTYSSNSRLFGIGGRNTVTIFGDLSQEEFLQVANSLQPVKG